MVSFLLGLGGWEMKLEPKAGVNFTSTFAEGKGWGGCVHASMRVCLIIWILGNLWFYLFIECNAMQVKEGGGALREKVKYSTV